MRHWFVPLLVLLFIAATDYTSSQIQLRTLRRSGRFLITPCGDTITIRGVNKMIVWTDDLDVRKASYAEIKKTGANCVRIVWLAHPTQNEADAGPDGLDRTIQDCIDADLIPMVELHDATGDWSNLQTTVDYWKNPQVLDVIRKHEKYLLINIANECGDETVTDEQFIAGYTSAVQQLRDAGIVAPFVIDASDWGKNLDQLVRVGQTLISADTEHNLIFSVHMYWAISDGADHAFIANQLQAAVDADIPLIVGEFTERFNRGTPCEYIADYQAIIEECQKKRIGWLAWEWGPGNEFSDASCVVMNMTEDSYFNTLKDGWAKTTAITSDYSINKTSITPDYIIDAGTCRPVGIADEQIAKITIRVLPNPVNNSGHVQIWIEYPALYSIAIYDGLGNLEQSYPRTLLVRGQVDIPLHSFSNGIHFCCVTSPTNSVTAKFIIDN